MSKPKKTKLELAIIQRVRTIRLSKGFTQEYIAGLLGLATSFISQIESPNNSSKYNLNHLNRLAYEMECSLKDFMPDNPIVEEDWKEND